MLAVDLGVDGADIERLLDPEKHYVSITSMIAMKTAPFHRTKKESSKSTWLKAIVEDTAPGAHTLSICIR